MSHPAFTDEDNAFLRSILDVPEDRNTWLVYADWLDDRSDPRAEFLRLAVERSLLAEDDPTRPAVETRLNELRTELDPHWMMMFDRARIWACPRAGWTAPRVCPSRRWNDLAATDVPDIRLCHECARPVFYCHTFEEALQYESCGQCSALSTRIPHERFPSELPVLPDTDTNDIEMFGEFEDDPPAPPPPRPWWKFW